MAQARCSARTRSGRPCAARPKVGSDRCRVHAGSAPKRGGEATGTAVPTSGTASLSGTDSRRLLLDLERLLARKVQGKGNAVPAGISPSALLDTLREHIDHLPPIAHASLLAVVRTALRHPRLDVSTVREVWEVLNTTVQGAIRRARRRWRGDYAVDEFGYDEEVLARLRPLYRFLYRRYWRVTTEGMEHVPAKGRALLVANTAGGLPWDGLMISVAVWEDHEKPRPVRPLFLNWFPTVPFLSTLFIRSGMALACPENAERLLRRNNLVAVFPEGLKGSGKLYRDRYRLARFGRGGFVRIAIQTQSPIIPVAVVGSEEIYPILARSDGIGKPLGLPMFPITPTFPWLGPLGLVPFPSKWRIRFLPPVVLDGAPAEKADDFVFVSDLANRIRGQIQDSLDEMRGVRPPGDPA